MNTKTINYVKAMLEDKRDELIATQLHILHQKNLPENHRVVETSTEDLEIHYEELTKGIFHLNQIIKDFTHEQDRIQEP